MKAHSLHETAEDAGPVEIPLKTEIVCPLTFTFENESSGGTTAGGFRSHPVGGARASIVCERASKIGSRSYSSWIAALEANIQGQGTHAARN